MRKFHSSSFITLASSFILHFSFFIIISFFFVGCTKTTKPKTSSLSGQIILVNDSDDPSLDPVDYSGVTVALYHLAVLDTTIVRINREYPSIGVQISQETEFDHRKAALVKQTTTNAEGKFTISDIPEGSYNLLAMKSGWGYRYVFNIQVTPGDNNLKSDDTSPITLFPIVLLDTIIYEDFVFSENHTYMITSNTIIFGNSIIQGNSAILIDPDFKLYFAGEISCPTGDKYWKVTSSDGIYTSLAVQISPFDLCSFEYHNTPVTISNMILDNSINGINTGSHNFNLSNSIIRDVSTSALNVNSESNISGILMYNTVTKGIMAYNSISLENSVFVNNRESCMLYQTQGTIQHCYFAGSYIGIRPFMEPCLIKNNCFDRNSVAIAPCASSPIIQYNNFYNNLRDIELNKGGTPSELLFCNPSITYNNFFGNNFYIHLKGSNSVFGDGSIIFSGVNTNQTYPNNYLKAADLTSHIYDVSYPGATIAFSVSMVPRIYSQINQAGI